jgi:hypothetical protein
LNQGREKYKRAALLMAELLEDMDRKRDNVLYGAVDKDQIDNPIEHRSREEKVKVMFDLLKQMQPYLSANNLTVIPAARN